MPYHVGFSGEGKPMRIRAAPVVLAASLLALLIRWLAGSLAVEHAPVPIDDARATRAIGGTASRMAFAFDASPLPIAGQTMFVFLALFGEAVASSEPGTALVPWGGAMTADDVRRLYESDPGEGDEFLFAPDRPCYRCGMSWTE
jgi:hypothetical protein